MIILSIETSCDETAISLLDCSGGIKNSSFKVLGNALHSQTKLHEQYGGVFPMMAKRAHIENIVPLMLHVLASQKSKIKTQNSNPPKLVSKIKKILEKDPGLFGHFEKHIFSIEKPKIDIVAVTEGPGLEPALWVGINFAKALGILWDIPVVGVNHMEGHFFSVLQSRKKVPLKFPTLALLVSGGHTELVLSPKPLSYKILGATRDDAVGEAFDKVARILGLPYPGGPQVSALAEKLRSSKANNPTSLTLPRPMIHSKDLDFSFSGIKTAVLYMVQKIPNLTEEIKMEITREFEDAVVEVLVSKTEKALVKNNVKTLIVAGGVSANKHLQKEIKKLQKKHSGLSIHFPDKKLTGDNAVMIGVAGYMRSLKANKLINLKALKAKGNLKIGG